MDNNDFAQPIVKEVQSTILVVLAGAAVGLLLFFALFYHQRSQRQPLPSVELRLQLLEHSGRAR